MTDRPPSAADPSPLLTGRTAAGWRFYVVVTPPTSATWSSSLAAADPLSGAALAFDLDLDRPEVRAADRQHALDEWLTFLHAHGFRAHGTTTDVTAWTAAAEHIEDRRFDEVVIVNDERGLSGALGRFADRMLARRLHRRFRLPASALTL